MKLVALVLALVTHCVPHAIAVQAREVDTKDAVNPYVRAIRATQNPDGTYGPPSSQPQTTARFLIALGSCAEKYVATDGPFVRNAISAMLAHQAADGGFTAPGSPRRVTTSAEAYLALSYTAKLGYDDSLARARAYLESIPATDVAKDEASEIVRLALGKRVDGVYFARQVESDLMPDAGAGWVTPFFERQRAAVNAELAKLDVAAVPGAVTRLLAILDALRAAEAVKKADSKPFAEIAFRAEPKDAAEARTRIESALKWLTAQQRDGRFMVKGVVDPGVTAIALSAVIRTAKHLNVERPAYVKQGLDWLSSLQKEDGAIYLIGLKNYVSSVAVEAFVASGDPSYDAVTTKAVGYLKSSQLDADEGYSSESDPYYGGFGYGSSEKPDLSNTQVALQAMHDAGVPTDDASFRKVIDFLQRCQNRPESGAAPIGASDGSIVVPGDDGGAVYRPGDSKAGTDPAPGAKEGDRHVVARSYGSMTYALLKSYLFAGLDPSDERVKAAFDWLCRNYTVDVNPGFKASAKKDVPYQGLFYYYLTMARALKAFGATTLTDAEGVARDWRKDLRSILFRTQSEAGSWQNLRSTRWMEEDPVLVTSYALLAFVETE